MSGGRELSPNAVNKERVVEEIDAMSNNHEGRVKKVLVVLCDQHSLDKNVVLTRLEFHGVVFRCDGVVVTPRKNEEHTNQLEATKAKNERLKSLLTSMTTARNKEKEAAAAEKGGN